MNSDLVTLGIDLGGTSAKGVALDADGQELARATQAFDLAQPLAFAAAVRSLVQSLESALGRPAFRVGLSAPGLADPHSRTIAFMPGRFPGLVGLDWSDYLDRPGVTILNDAHAALLGEVWRGAAHGARDVFMLTLGTGVGGAAMVDGHLLRGHSGKAGHLGHITLDPYGPPDITRVPGSLEDAIGNYNVAARSAGRFASTHDLLRAHESGDPLASAVWLRSVRALAAGIASLANVLDPEIVVVGGGIARAGDTLFVPLRQTVAQFEWAVCGHSLRILPAQLGDLAGAFGAAWFATHPTSPSPDAASDRSD